MDWIKKIRSLPTGHSEVYYLGKRYGLSKTEFNAGRCIKIYAEELGGSHFISFNCYYTVRSILLKPCEMPEQDVIHFLEHYKFDGQ